MMGQYTDQRFAAITAIVSDQLTSVDHVSYQTTRRFRFHFPVPIIWRITVVSTAYSRLRLPVSTNSTSRLSVDLRWLSMVLRHLPSGFLFIFWLPTTACFGLRLPACTNPIHHLSIHLSADSCDSGHHQLFSHLRPTDHPGYLKRPDSSIIFSFFCQ